MILALIKGSIYVSSITLFGMIIYAFVVIYKAKNVR
jgi:hypothetical protein